MGSTYVRTVVPELCTGTAVPNVPYAPYVMLPSTRTGTYATLPAPLLRLIYFFLSHVPVYDNCMQVSET